MASITSTLGRDGHANNVLEVEERGDVWLGSSGTIMTIIIILPWEDDVDMIHFERKQTRTRRAWTSGT